MKLLMLSDLHGISKNLRLLEEKVLLKDFNYIIILGDLFYSVNSNTEDEKIIIQFLNKYQKKLMIVRGNCDKNSDISKIPVKVDDVTYLNVDGMDFYFTHGHIYNYYQNSTFSNGILIYGHEHIPYIKKENDMIYINVGSISLPRDDYGKTFAIYENKTIKIYQLETMNPIFSISVKDF